MQRFKLPAILLAGFAVLFYIFFQYCKQAPGLGAINPFKLPGLHGAMTPEEEKRCPSPRKQNPGR